MKTIERNGLTFRVEIEYDPYTDFAEPDEEPERHRAWLKDEWYYVGVVVTLLDIEGNETDAAQSLWAIESDSGAYLQEVAGELADECAHDVQSRLDYGPFGTRYTSGARSWIVSETVA